MYTDLENKIPAHWSTLKSQSVDGMELEDAIGLYLIRVLEYGVSDTKTRETLLDIENNFHKVDHDEVYNDGFQAGLDEGYSEGYDEGYSVGIEEASKSSD